MIMNIDHHRPDNYILPSNINIFLAVFNVKSRSAEFENAVEAP